MVDVVAVVGARLSSSRLPRKHLLPLEGKPLIARLFERLDAVPLIRKAVLATTADAENRDLVAWAEAAGRPVVAYSGDVNDLVGRIDHIVARERPELVLYICGDCPLIDPDIITKMIRALARGADLVRVPPQNGFAVVHEGIDLYPFRIWNKLVLEAELPFEREHVGQSLKKFAADLNTVEVVDEPWFYRPKQRLSVDTASDYRFMAEIYRRWYAANPADSLVSLRWVFEEVDRDPELRFLNAHVRQKTAHEKAPRVLFATAGGHGVGLGHISRTLVAAAGLQDVAAAGIHLVIEGESFVRKELELIPHDFTAAGGLRSRLEEVLAAKPYQVLVLDLPARMIDEAWHRFLDTQRRAGVLIVSLDFTVKKADLVDLQWVPSFYLRGEDEETNNVVFGWECFLLNAGAVPRTWKPGSDVIVFSGGSDVHGLGERLPALLDARLPAHFRIHWVRGPFAQAPVIPPAANRRLDWVTHNNPANIKQLMMQANYGFSLYGVTLFECLHLGLPTVTFAPGRQTDDHELKALAQAELTDVGRDLEETVDHLCTLIFDPHRAQAFSEAGRQRLDGRGPRRLAGKILEKLGRNPLP